VLHAATSGLTNCPGGLANDCDADGTLDCFETCPQDPNKTAAGICGCGVSDADSDGDGTVDCQDGCPLNPFKTSNAGCACDQVDIDSNGDGTVDGCASFAQVCT
jgi:hypothetical protein